VGNVQQDGFTCQPTDGTRSSPSPEGHKNVICYKQFRTPLGTEVALLGNHQSTQTHMLRHQDVRELRAVESPTNVAITVVDRRDLASGNDCECSSQLAAQR
jgi:hypothetical protein